MSFSLSSLVRLIVAVALGSTMLAVGVSKLDPSRPIRRARGATRYFNLNEYFMNLADRTPRWLDAETGRVVSHPLEDGDVLEAASAAPWVDERGQSQVVGRWSSRTRMGPASVTTDFGLARYTFPGGKLLDHVSTEIVPVGPPCWYPGVRSRVLFAGGDGMLYHYAFEPDPAEAEADPSAGRDASPTPLVWACRKPGLGKVYMSDLTRPEDPSLRDYVVVALREQSAGPSTRRTYTRSALWWLKLDPAGLEIIGVGRLLQPDGRGEGAGTNDQRTPTIGPLPGGKLAVAYLSDRGRKQGWELRIVPIEFGVGQEGPVALESAGVTLASDCQPAHPSFSPDGRWLNAVAVSSESNGKILRLPLARLSSGRECRARRPGFALSIAAGTCHNRGERDRPERPIPPPFTEAVPMPRAKRLPPALVLLAVLAADLGARPAPAPAAVTRDEVERAIRSGVRYLVRQQRPDGSWIETDEDARTGTTSLVTLALLTAGEPVDSPHIAKALEYLRKFDPGQLDSVYSVSLQTMVFAAATPKADIVRITSNVAWLEDAQLKPGDHAPWPGSWSYKASKTRHGDNSNSQYALLGLNAASEAGVKVKEEVWKLAREYWQHYQQLDGSWAYTPDATNGTTSSMTCAGISSLVISGLKRFRGAERLVGDHGVEDCGKGAADPNLERGIRWISTHFQVGQNFGAGQQWKYYYLYGLERTGRLSGIRFFGDHDWYREGAEEIVHDQDKLEGFWRGQQYERYPAISTSFALLFLAKGRSPVVVNKLRHGSGTDWNNDADDVRNLVGAVSRDWNHLLTWQVVDPSSARVEDMLQAPIAFINGHDAPEFSARGEQNLRDFVEQGGFIFAEACCGKPEFDRGFRALMKRVFPDQDYELHPLAADHAVWRSRWPLNAQDHPLWGIEHGCRTVVVYSPDDLSCDWNQMETQSELPRVTRSTRIGQNVVDYATGRELPADKLSTPEVKNFNVVAPRRGALRIAKLRHAGDWNIAPLAIPNLTTTLRDKLKFDVVINHKELYPRDPNLVHYPLIYIHGRAALSFDAEDRAALRRHLDPGGGTLFADAACGSPAFDAAFRKFVAELLPGNPMIPIPRDDEIYSNKTHYDLKDVQYTKPAGGGKDYPQLEGVKVNGRWGVIYSKYDIGCSLEKHQGLDCKGYAYESAMRIAANIVIYATLP